MNGAGRAIWPVRVATGIAIVAAAGAALARVAEGSAGSSLPFRTACTRSTADEAGRPAAATVWLQGGEGAR